MLDHEKSVEVSKSAILDQHLDLEAFGTGSEDFSPTTRLLSGVEYIRAVLGRFLEQTQSAILNHPALFLTRLLAALGVIYLTHSLVLGQVIRNPDRNILHRRPPHAIENSLSLNYNHTRQVSHITSKAIIVASTTNEETAWVHEYFPDWRINVYVVDDHAADYTLLKNVGREAAVYLTYIINNYYTLPDYMVFLHADRYQWHNDDPMYDGVNPVKNLQLDYVKEVGYASLRCSWNPGCPIGLRPNLTAEDGMFGIKHTYATTFQEFFPDEELPEEVGTACCAQFAITKKQIQLRPVWQYEKVREWLWATSVSSGRSGRVMEYMWHILFKKPTILCPDAATCYCKTFGLCDLQCSGASSCNGRYKLPPWNKGIPAGWPYQGQGTNGYPKYGWWQKFYPDEHFGLEYMQPFTNISEALPSDGLGEVDEASSEGLAAKY